jgi:DNA-binding XRE family transcriptional regulator
MPRKAYLQAEELGPLAKELRLKTGMKKAQVARELGVGRPSIQLAEEDPEQSLTALRIRLIERFSSYEVLGPVYLLRRKRRAAKT